MDCRRILMLNLSHIGDILFTTPVIRAIKSRFPTSQIACVVSEGMADVLKHDPLVNELILREKGVAGLVSLIPRLRQFRPDTCLVFSSNSLGLSMAAWLSGARVRVGFDETGMSQFLTHRVHWDPDAHRVDTYLGLATVLGAEIDSPKIKMHVVEEDREFASELLRSFGLGDSPIVALNPSATVVVNRWFPDRFGDLAKRLKGEGFDVVVLGASTDRDLVDEVMRAAGDSAVDLCGKTKIGELAAVIERCSVVVSNDTGPMHVAVAVGTPVVAIFGAADPSVTGPYDPSSKVLWERAHCAPCWGVRPCEGLECMQMIGVDTAFDAVMSRVRTGNTSG